MSNGEGVLVHCQAGISTSRLFEGSGSTAHEGNAYVGRSVSVVAAYLMFTKDLDFSTALNMIRDARPIAKYAFSFIYTPTVTIHPSLSVVRMTHSSDSLSFSVLRHVRSLTKTKRSGLFILSEPFKMSEPAESQD